MELKQWRDAETMHTILQFSISDYELASAKLDALDRAVINTPASKDTPIADALQSAQILAFRIEQQNHASKEVSHDAGR